MFVDGGTCAIAQSEPASKFTAHGLVSFARSIPFTRFAIIILLIIIVLRAVY